MTKPSLSSAGFDVRPWLRQPLVILNAGRRRFPLGRATQHEVVTTHRLILVLRGQMDYTLEDQTWRIPAGVQLFVPAWSRRVWSVPVRGFCEILWCEFDDGGLETGRPGLGIRRLTKPEKWLEKNAHLRLIRHFAEEAPREALLEGELKALLARFGDRAEIASARGRRLPGPPEFHPRVKLALRGLEHYYREPDALDRLYQASGLSPNYFRRQFVRALQCSPRTFIERLRLRRARYLLRETPRSVKEIAGEVGYSDALYFSKSYRRFWKIAPSRERGG